MNTSMLIYCIIALAISALTQFLIIDVSHKKGIFIDDHESDLPQKLHEQPTPRIGGLGVFLGLICLIVDSKIGNYLLISLLPAFIAGFLEDLYGTISPFRRLLIMSFASFLVIYLLKAYICDFGYFTVPSILGIIISIVAILGLINGTNLIDGFNGLSSGISLLILASYCATAYLVGDTSMAMVSGVCFAAVLGFYIFNFPSGKIFLGDGGAYTIGFILASLGILIVKNNPSTIHPSFTLLILIYPVWEVIFSFSRRLIDGKSPLHPDSFHLHQLVFKTIANEKNSITSLLIYPLVALFCIFAVFNCNNVLNLTIGVLSFIAIYCVLYLQLKKRV